MALQALDRKPAAIEAFRCAVAIDPDNSSARHLIAALSGADATAVPADYVIRLFDDYAEKFDRHLQGELRYQTPAKMRGCFDRALPDGKSMRLAIDLGCGTGLSGEVFKDIVERLVGIDLSCGMLAQARKKNIYHQLIEGDLLPGIAALPDPADLFLAADVFVYIGDLSAVFAAVTGKMTPGGLFCFSIEAAAAGDYALLETGRFSILKAISTTLTCRSD